MSTICHPVACTLHDAFEVANMRGKPIAIRWHDEKGELYQDMVLANDLPVKDREEFLMVAASDKTDQCIRLE